MKSMKLVRFVVLRVSYFLLFMLLLLIVQMPNVQASVVPDEGDGLPLDALAQTSNRPMAEAIAVDNFMVDQASIELRSLADQGKTAGTSVSGQGILGGERDMYLHLINYGNGNNGVRSEVSGGAYTYGQDPLVEAEGYLQWDGVDGSGDLNPIGLNHLDLTAGRTQDAMLVQVLFADLPIDMRVRAYTDANNWSRVNIQLPGGTFQTTNIVFPFDAFSTMAGNGANFEDIGAIEYYLTSKTAPDFVLIGISTTAILTSTKTDAVLVDNNNDGMANPGETLRYTVLLENIDDLYNASVFDVVFSDTPDPYTTLVTGSVTTTRGTITDGNTNGDTSVGVTVGDIHDGESVTITFDVVIDNPLLAGVEFVCNQGNIDTSNSELVTDDPDTEDTPDPTCTPIIAAPDLTITKDDGGVRTEAGGIVIYTLDYANVGNQDATGVTITDTVPINTTFNTVSSTPGWSCVPDTNAGSLCTYTIGDFDVGDTGSIDFAVTVDDPVPAGVDQIENTAWIQDDGSNGPDPTPENNRDDDDTPLDAAPDLMITKDDGGVRTEPGGVVIYTLDYENIGDQDATGVIISDTVPTYTTFNTDSSTPGWSCLPNGNAGNLCTFTVGGLAVGGSGSVDFAVTVDDPLPAGVMEIENRACIADDGNNGPDPTPGNNCDDDDTPIDAAPDLMITKDDGGVRTEPGGVVIYTLDYANVGDQDATGVIITDTVPINTTFNTVSSTPGWSCIPDTNAGSLCTYTIGDFDVGDTGSIDFAVTVDDPVPAGVDQIENTAWIQDDGNNGPDPTPENNKDDDDTPLDAEPDLMITKDDGGVRTEPGGVVIYTLDYENIGDQDATGVMISDTVPTYTTFNTVSSTPGWTCLPNGNAGSLCTFTVGGLAVGGSGSVDFAITVDDPLPAGVMEIENRACIADDGNNGPDPTPENNCDDDDTPVDAAPDLTILKDDGGVRTEPGGVVIYTLDYANVGDQDATGVTITDTVPIYTTFNTVSSTPGWSCVPNLNAGSLCTILIGALDAGDTGSVDFAVTVDDPVPAGVTEIENTAWIQDDGNNGPDPTPENNKDDDDTPLDAAPDLTILKDDGGVRTAPGRTVIYTINYANIGDQGATGVTITDNVPTYTTFSPGSSTAGWSCTPNNNAGSACTFNVGSLAAGQSGSVFFAVVVDNPLPDGVMEIFNATCIDDDGSNGEDPTPENNCDDDDTPVDAQPDLTILKDDGGVSTEPGGIVIYTLDYANIGNQDATGVTISDTVPTYTSFNPGSSTAGWSCVPGIQAGSLCSFVVGDLAAGAGGSVNFAVTVDDPLPDGIMEIFNATCIADDGSNGADPTPENNCDDDDTPVIVEWFLYLPMILVSPPPPTPTPTPTPTSDSHPHADTDLHTHAATVHRRYPAPQRHRR